MYSLTLACHALIVPCLLRRAREGFQGPAYQLEAVELAVIWWSAISPFSTPRGTEQPGSGDQIRNVLLQSPANFPTDRLSVCPSVEHLTIKLTSVEFHADSGLVVPAERVEPNEPSNQRRKECVYICFIGILVASEFLDKSKMRQRKSEVTHFSHHLEPKSVCIDHGGVLTSPPSNTLCCLPYRRSTSCDLCCRRSHIWSHTGNRTSAWLLEWPPGWSLLVVGSPPTPRESTGSR